MRMRPVAEFVMRGRPQAIGLAVLFASLPVLHWLSAAIVGLVFLRRGDTEGIIVLLWTSLPLLVLFWMTGDPGPAMTIVGVAVLASVLRTTKSWQTTVSAVIVIAGSSMLVFDAMSAQVFDEFVKLFLSLSEASRSQLDKSAVGQLGKMSDEELFIQTRALLFGFFAMGQALAMLGFLALARWWQSLLYNPDGFQQEFHQLRLTPVIATTVLGLVFVCIATNNLTFLRWVPLLTVPLIVAAVALIHWFVAERALSGRWLVGFYCVTFILMQLVYPFLAFLALLDSWLDLRKRIRLDREV